MALQAWDKSLREENDALKQQLMISASPNPGPAPVRPEDIPTAPSSPYEKGKSPHKLAGLQINPNTILLPKEPKEAETDEDYGEGEVGDGWKLSHGEGRGPQPKYHDEYNQPLKFPPWMQMFPDGEVREIPWMKEKYKNEHPELMISQSRKDKVIQNTVDRYGKKGGEYQDEDKLLRNLLTIAESTRV